ncbi:prenyltransferase/squalene oxidase repeat-containing protein [Thalassospira sp. SM2505]|uniref:Squalene cyclase C-terminal domain-containing protein n=1 Tax=Thalassospira profundimaris TaxID=502049 RepID=A0A367WUM7_9PROT|nr:hypothetical protein [Thalassospira profundimaris]RCK45087.1 hypothetical protein TH30_13875 [Thalassospira profundimaris]
MNRAVLINVRDRVLARMRQADFAGADPFDGLESRLFQVSGLGRFRIARLIWLQAIKRGPGVLRRFAMIPPMMNPKTLALLNGGAGGVRLGDFSGQLIAMQNADGGWGYPFEWQARAFYARRHQSNAIVTSFVIDGLLAGGMTPDHAALIRAGEFIARDLWRDGYFAYFDHDASEIYNASLWAAFALNRILPGNEKSRRALVRVINAQCDDGSWAYGTRGHHGFVDGFHTGYILDLLDRFRTTGVEGAEIGGLDGVIARGWQFYRSNCFDPDGIPRSFASKDGYLDAHAVAQAMAGLCRFGEVVDAVRLAHWAVQMLFDPARDVFHAGIGRFGVDRQNYLRWTQAWMVWALSIVIERMALKQQDTPMPTLDPNAALSFPHPDPDRADKEAALRNLSEDAFCTLYAITRDEAARMKNTGEMEALYGLTRGMKTLQRIGGERGIILRIARSGA